MASRRRTLLFVAALAFAAPLVPVAAATAGPAQDTTGAFVGGPVQGETTSTVPAATTTAAGAATVTEATVVEEEPVTESRRVVTESRKVAAVIGALILVALLLMLLTVRYWRNTKPIPPDADGAAPADGVDDADGDADGDGEEPDEPSEKAKITQALDLDSIFTATDDDDEVVAAPVTASVAAATAASATAEDGAPGTDHESADDDWEPHTGEQERVELPTAGPARPTAAARRKALGISSDT